MLSNTFGHINSNISRIKHWQVFFLNLRPLAVIMLLFCQKVLLQIVNLLMFYPTNVSHYTVYTRTFVWTKVSDDTLFLLF